MKDFSHINIAEVPAPLRGRNNTIRFLMPLAHVICDSNKSRAMIGFLTVDNFAPGKIPEPDTWFKPAKFYDEERRNQQANDLDGKDIASIFIRFESGHSSNITVRLLFNFDISCTEQTFLEVPEEDGIIRLPTNHNGRQMRPESDCILIARPDAISDLDPVITESQYVLTPHTVPFDRFCGVWSLIDRAWLEIPNDGELARMNNYKSDVDIAMHIAHRQFYWEKKNEVEQNNENWQRSDYVHYATGQLPDQLIAPRPLILLLLLGRPVIFGLTKNSFL